jgi:hypothetical protein
VTTKSEPMVGGGHRVSTTAEAAKPKRRRPHRVSIQRAKNGGHTVEHSFQSNGGGFEPPVTHVFGKSDGAKLVQHLRRHLLIQDGGATDLTNGGEDDGDEG